MTTCRSVIINVRVGEMAQLDFPYPCDSAVVTLQHANARPFYRSADHTVHVTVFKPKSYELYCAGLDQCFST